MTQEKIEELNTLLNVALAISDDLNLATIGIKISETIDALRPEFELSRISHLKLASG